jgi:hypothetical protein
LALAVSSCSETRVANALEDSNPPYAAIEGGLVAARQLLVPVGAGELELLGEVLAKIADVVLFPVVGRKHERVGRNGHRSKRTFACDVQWGFTVV